MQFLEWEDTYNIGVKEIDIQHRGLFDIISKLSASRRYGTDGKYFFAMLIQLVDYTKIHFATELKLVGGQRRGCQRDLKLAHVSSLLGQ